MSGSPGIAVLDLARRHREDADVVERYSSHDAEIIRRLADEYEDAVKRSLPEWWTLPAVQTAKPWSMKSLRRRAKALEQDGKARRGKNGHWELRWDAVLALPQPPVRLEEIDPEDEAMLERLASE